jgi:hypothetical protein
MKVHHPISHHPHSKLTTQILNPGLTPLTNAEVLRHVADVQTRYYAPDSYREPPQTLKSILRDVRTILERPSQPTVAVQRPEKPFSKPKRNPLVSDSRVIVALTRKLRGGKFRLLQSEVLQIFNHVPRDREKLSMLLEDAEQRFSEEALDEMVAVIEDVLVHGRGLEDVAMSGAENGKTSNVNGDGEEVEAKGEDVEMER